MNMTTEQITAAYPNVAKLESQAGRELLAAVMEQLQALAAENVGLKSAAKKVIKLNREHAKERYGDPNVAESWAYVKILRKAKVETPATARFVAEMKAQFRAEGAHFVANRMLAAWDAVMPDFPGRALTQRECYQMGLEAGKASAQLTPVVPENISGPLAHAYKELTPQFMRNHLSCFERYGTPPGDMVVIQALRIALEGMERRAAMLNGGQS